MIIGHRNNGLFSGLIDAPDPETMKRAFEQARPAIERLANRMREIKEREKSGEESPFLTICPRLLGKAGGAAE